MSVTVEFLPGPYTSALTRTAAESALKGHPAIRKGAAYALEQLDGRWVAAIVHTAADAPFAGGGPADSDEESPAPKSEGPGDVEPSEGESKPPKGDGDSDDSGSEGGESGPPKEKGKGGLEHQLLDMVMQIMDALGIQPADPMGADPMAAGPDAGLGPDAGGPPGPPGAGGPPAGPPHGGGGGAPLHGGGPAEQHVIHERVTKPGETPPGGTPIGAPAFASVRADHPWHNVVGNVASFQVADKIGNESLSKVKDELTALASEINYRVAKIREDRDDDGDRVAVAVITAH